MNLNHQTTEQFMTRFREAYRGSVGEECARMSVWLDKALTAGDVPDTTARNAFGMTVSKWATFKAKAKTLRTNADAVRNARGE